MATEQTNPAVPDFETIARNANQLAEVFRQSAAASLKMSKGTSTTTGPGLPVTMVFQAWRTAVGTISPRVGWNTRLQ